MKKVILIIPIIVTIIGLLIISGTNDEAKREKTVFHVTLADPKMYHDGVYTEKFSIDKGEYFFNFIPNGDSPEFLSISFSNGFNFNENFRLNGTLHDTGISQYYTWDYDGQKRLSVDSSQEVIIQINPNGNLLGSVSVDILENNKGVTP